MATQKLYAGAKLRETRLRLNLTQKAFAERLGVSLPYLNQMENNNRPVSSAVILALVQEFEFDVNELAMGEGERLASDLREALADPLFTDKVPPADLRLLTTNAPALARAFLSLHEAYRQANERLASLAEALGQEGVRPGASPWDEVRDFFHYCDNYIDAVDRAAERFASESDGDIDAAIAKACDQLGITVHVSHDVPGVRHYDAAWIDPVALGLGKRGDPAVSSAAPDRDVDVQRPDRRDPRLGAVPDRNGALHRADRPGQLLRGRRLTALWPVSGRGARASI